MWMRVATKKVFKPEHVAIVRSPNNHRSAGPGFNKPYTTQDQGTHDPLAEFRLRD